ncbi:MAG: PhzF family phenazine biosynthesis protein [Desulfobulbaceae bacterium]|nr:PhzF family phenazine biosynthesis protein [Desulfobulbaceae bacterium]
MDIPYFHIDAFTGRVFAGNPAGVCLLSDWPADDILQAIASENRLSETAFLVGGGCNYALRWFTPESEVDLCGHATLAAASVLHEHTDIRADQTITFQSQSGQLSVSRLGDLFTLDFPARPGKSCPQLPELTAALGVEPEAVFAARDLLAVFPDRKSVAELRPDLARLAALDYLGVIVTAPDDTIDFVSRFFAPGAGVPEDPVTGSSHCTLIPYWAQRLGKDTLHAQQISERGGELFCENRGERVLISGRAVEYLNGTLHIPV